MTEIVRWIRRRPLSLGLFAFLILWYGLEMAVVNFYGEETAIWWFYWEPLEISPGVLLSPISHNIHTLTHIGANSAILLAVGSYAEPHLSRDRFLFVAIVLGFTSLVMTNFLAIITNVSGVFPTQWATAGMSAGLLALTSYIALIRRDVISEVKEKENPTTKDKLEWTLIATLLTSIVVVPLYEIFVMNPTNMGHIMGVVVGCGYYGLQIRFGEISTDQSSAA